MDHFFDFSRKTNILSSFVISFEFIATTDPEKILTTDGNFVVLCNNSTTLHSFNNTLDYLFRDLRNNINKIVNSYQTKGELLVELLNVTSLLESYKKLIRVEQSENGEVYYHSKFFIDVDFPAYHYGLPPEEVIVDPSGIDEIMFSDYVKAILRSINDIVDFLILLREIFIKTPSSDLPLKSNSSLKPDVSSIVDPLKFFDHFIFHNGFNSFKRNFFPSDDEQSYMNVVNINRDEESYIYIESDENGNVDEIKVFFAKELHRLLKEQFDISLGLIDQKVKSFQAEPEKMSSVLDLHISHCIGMKDRLNEKSEFKRYADIFDCITSIASRLIDKYSAFINHDLCYRIDPIKYALPLPEKLIWKGKPKEFALTFLKLMDSKNISLSLSGDDDYEPIYKKLVSFFNLKSDPSGRGKKKGSASPFVDDATALQYFREVHADTAKTPRK